MTLRTWLKYSSDVIFLLRKACLGGGEGFQQFGVVIGVLFCKTVVSFEDFLESRWIRYCCCEPGLELLKVKRG